MVVTPVTFGKKIPPPGKSKVWIRTLDDFEKYWPVALTNLGYQPGQSGFVELDIDNVNGEAVAQSLGCFSEPTFTVQTPRALAPEGHAKKFARAQRLRFRMPLELSFGKCTLHGALEVFGNSGHVLLPPSWITEYAAGYSMLVDVPPLACPPRLEAALREASTPRIVRQSQRRATGLLEALERATGQRLTLRRGRSLTVCCPAHADGTPSLSVSLGDDGEPVVVCHAGCTFAAILGSLGLSRRAA